MPKTTSSRRTTAKQPAKRAAQRATKGADLDQALRALIKRRAPALRELAKH